MNNRHKIVLLMASILFIAIGSGINKKKNPKTLKKTIINTGSSFESQWAPTASAVVVNNDKTLVVENLLNQVIQDDENYQIHQDKLAQICNDSYELCREYLDGQKEELYSWPLEKGIVFFEVIVENDRFTSSSLVEVLGYKLPKKLTEINDHHDTNLQNLNMLKGVVVDEFQKKVDRQAVSIEDREAYKGALVEIAKNESDLMLVRDAVSILKGTFYLNSRDLQAIVGSRSGEDRVAYQDFL